MSLAPHFAIFFFLMVIAVLVYFFSGERRLKRRILGLPISDTIAQTPENQDVRVSGTLAYVEGKAPLTAPISGRPCVAWRVTVEEKRSSGKSSHWHKLIDDTDSTDFALEDESGRAIVDGTALKMALEFDAGAGQSMFSEGSGKLQSYLSERGIDTHGMLLRKTLRAREGVLELGEIVTVGGSGTFMNDPSSPAGYRGSAKLLHIKAMSNGELLASDDAKMRRGQGKKN